MRVAAIDCGTNSIRLLIADTAGSHGLEEVVRRMEIARLGQGVDRSGELAPEALARTFAVIEDYARECLAHRVDRVRVVATSATRDAKNRQAFVCGVRERIGVEPEVASGLEEATLAFNGASLAAAGHDPILVVDIGGGSTELVLGSPGGAVWAQHSMDVGSVRMRERHFRHDPPTCEEVARARADVREQLAAALEVVPVGAARALIGTAGTITTLTAETLGLDTYDPARVHAALTSFEEMERAAQWFMTAPAAARAARGYMHPGRVDVIASGAVVFSEILRCVVQQTAAAGHTLGHVITSERDILDGIALGLAHDEEKS